MFISQREYQELVSKSENHDHLNSTVDSLNQIIASYDRDMKIFKQDYDRAIAQKDREKDEADRRAQVDKDTSVREAVEAVTDKLKQENTTLRIEKERASDRAAMLEKAFENLGFDVKDMKDILSKLVDGLIAKHEINVIKTS